ncbi:UNVERIFIED_CONTAM: Retrovirus-related Pol polyprotein from transposon RE1 [Sesamum indicum]
MEPLPHVDKAYSMVMRVERQRKVHMESTETGHAKDTCFKIHGIPDWYKELVDKRKKGTVEGRAYMAEERGVTTEATTSSTSLISELLEALKLIQSKGTSDPVKVHFAQLDESAGMASSTTLTEHISSSWIVDTGATRHWCGDISLLNFLTPTHSPSVIHLPNGTTITATHIGTAQLSHNFSLEQVLHIPSFQHNLLSVSQLCNSLPVRFSFTNSLCLLQDLKTEEVLAIGKRIGKLYYLDSHSFTSAVQSSHLNIASESLQFSSDNDTYTLWHKRLSHPSENVLTHISSLHFNTNVKTSICHVCPLAKQVRKNFSLSESISVSPFDLVHVDIWGPYKQSSISGCHYVLTLVDDHSRATWTYLMRYKSQTLSFLSSFIKQIQTQFGLLVKQIRTDNGPEFLSSSCQNLFASCGIIHQKSCVYTPQQNGVVERKHKHLLQVARALMFESHLPRQFWADSILTATFIINRLPSPILNWKSPYELLHKTILSYHFLKTYGCLCYATNVISPTEPETTTPESSQISTASSDPSLSHDTLEPQVGDSLSTLSPSPVPLCRSTRPSHKPQWLNDFICHSSTDSTPSNLCITSSHLSFMAALSTVQEPKNYAQAKDIPEWQQAMEVELAALEENDTWLVTDLPPNKKAIGCKWVYKVKLKQDGSVDRYKARLVAKGYNQIEGIDYFERFSPVAKVVTVRLFVAIAFAFGWTLHQIDINNAFLHGYLDEDIYMLPPDGYSLPTGQVCKLKRSLYGLKQASRQWNHEFTTKLLAYGFLQSPNDHCLFSKSVGFDKIFLLVYVDDVLISSSADHLIQPVKDYLHGLFTIKDLGQAHYFLGLEIARSSNGISVTQQKYIHDIIHDAGLDNAKAVHTPLPAGLKLSACGTPLDDPEPYRRLFGRLLYLGFTRPDVSYGAQQLSQFIHCPCQEHMTAALHLVKYLKGSSTTGLFFPAQNSSSSVGYCDADWASCPDSRRSLTGYCIFLGSALISWKTKKQPTVSRSTAESEYRSLATTVCELQWVSYLLRDFQVPVHTPIPLYCDNQAAVHIVGNWLFTNGRNIWRLIVILFATSTRMVLFSPLISLVIVSSLIASPRPYLVLLSRPSSPSWAWLHFPQVQLEGGCCKLHVLQLLSSSWSYLRRVHSRVDLLCPSSPVLHFVLCFVFFVLKVAFLCSAFSVILYSSLRFFLVVKLVAYVGLAVSQLGYFFFSAI